MKTIYISVCVIGLLIICEACSSLNYNRKHDEQAMRIVVFEDFVSSRLGHDTNVLSAKYFFLDTVSLPETQVLSKYFLNSDPPVICGTDRLIHGENGIALDRVTGGSVIVFCVTIDSVAFPRAEVTITAYTGNTGLDSFNYTLLFTNKEWHVVIKKQGPMS
jgi:hypothetical protein